MYHAENAALRFVNSIEDDGKTRDINAFRDMAGLLRLVGDPALSQARAVPLAELLSFREALFAVLSSIASGKSPDPSYDAAVRAAIAASLARANLSLSSDGLRLGPGPSSTQTDVLALSAYALLTSEDVPRLSECHRCTRLFIDRGRGKGRRWCDMARCGNRSKAESFRARKRAAGDSVR
ncbi:CGNR zinc finger domain-containing protein [Gymnodinialimonas hymeniacidonis]|uniref:CGNR zinc finger domain-containing protein n=1 Tax=Gymnodinialimonas hymeniacidonis TaxID=3126508 RepID=UPI0034C67E8E